VTTTTSKRVAFETARLRLARHVLAGDETRYEALAHAVTVSGTALGMERTGVWFFDDTQQDLQCACLYTLSSKSYESGEILRASTFPDYVAALRERRAIAASDARTHHLTCELTADYLVPHGIVSMLDAPIIFGGRVVGVVCHEHVGEPRTFEQHELDFSGTVADMIATIEEQSARVRLERTLREQEGRVQRAAKLEALGRLARTAAHDFNNVLTVIMATAEQLRLHEDGNVTDRARDLLETAELGGRIARELLVLGRDEPSRQVAVHLDKSVNAIVPILRARFGSDMEVNAEIRVSDPVVLADPTQIERILLNLGVNAGEASGERGRIDIRVRDAEPNEVRGRGWLVLEVEDRGSGLSDDVKAHLFEPYFTTKSHGTGLGLASVYGIVRQLKGRIVAESVYGRGTTFSVLLPRML
jgi:two-component system, cell cycle sensor histidine kinase and response regulator CckA